MAAADDKPSTSDKVSTSSAVDEEIADPRSRRLTWREVWWPLAVAVAWVLLRSQQIVEQLLNRHSRKPITFTTVDVYAANLKVGDQHTTPKFENSDAAFDELEHHLETGEIEIVGTDFARVGDRESSRLEMGKQQTIFSSEISSLVPYNDNGTLCLIPRDWRAAHGSTRTNLRGYRNLLVRSAQLAVRFPEETEQLAHVPSDAVVREKTEPKAALLHEAPRKHEEAPEPTDAEVPAPTDAPAPPRKVSEAELRQCLLDIVKERPPHIPPLAEEAAKNEVERRLGAPVSRARIRQALKDVAPHFKLRRGRPRKNAQ